MAIIRLEPAIRRDGCGDGKALRELLSIDHADDDACEASFGLGVGFQAIGHRLLDDIVKENREFFLGDMEKLPFSVRALSFSRPSPLVCYPDKELAKKGYDAEEGLRVSNESALKNSQQREKFLEEREKALVILRKYVATQKLPDLNALLTQPFELGDIPARLEEVTKLVPGDDEPDVFRGDHRYQYNAVREMISEIGEIDEKIKILDSLKDEWRKPVYSDCNGNEEILYALSPMTLLISFKSFEGMKDSIMGLEPKLWEKHLSACNDGKEVFSKLFSIKGRDLKRSCVAISSHAEAYDGGKPTIENLLWLMSETYGESASIFLPLIMETISLEKGDVIKINSRTPHSFIDGQCVIVSANSDNRVIVGPDGSGAEEFASVASFEGEIVTPCKPESDEGNIRTYEAEPFQMKVFSPGKYAVEDDGPSTFFSIESFQRLESNEGSLTLAPGEACFLPYGEGVCGFSVLGTMLEARCK